MRSHIALVLSTLLLTPVRAHSESLLWARGDATVAPPECSLTCLGTLVPQFCGSLTNTTCICTNVELTAALGGCVSGACNITDSMLVQRYSAQSCQIPDDWLRQRQQMNVYYTVPALATFFVAARIFVRWKLETGLGADDYMMVAALFAYLTDAALGIGIALNGFGRHTFWLSTSQVSQALKFFYMAELFYILAITLTKLSLLLFFRRIFPNKSFRMSIWIMFGFIIMSNFSLQMALCFQCIPFHANWTNWMYKVKPVKCINSFAAVYVAAALSIFHDVVILCMPLPILWRLNLPWQKKANLLVMFSVGSFVLICSLIRLPSLLKLGSSTDPSYDQAPIAVWTDLEIGVGVICGCLPAFRSLIGYLFPNLKMTLTGSGNNKTPGAYPSQRSNKKFDKNRIDSSTRTFIELDDRNTSGEELERGQNERSSIKSCESQTPITEKLVPHPGKGYGNQATVGVREIDDERRENSSRTNIILMTKTVEQSRN